MSRPRSADDRHFFISGAALLVLSLLNAWLVLGAGPAFRALIPDSPYPRSGIFFAALLAPLTQALALLLTWWLQRGGGRALRLDVKCLQGLALALLPALGLAPRLVPGEWLLPAVGAIWLAALAAQAAALLIHLRRALDQGLAPAGRFLAAGFFGLPLVLYLGLAFWFGTFFSATGDEPYYLLVAESLAHDHDLNLDNQLEQRSFRAYYWQPHLAPQNMTRGEDGTRSTAYATLFPLLLAPGSLLHPRWGPTVTVVVISALLSLAIFLLCLELTADTGASFFAWAAASFTLPLLSFSSQIYPETAAALAATLLLRAALRARPGSGPRLREALTVFVWALLLTALKARYLPIALAGAAVYLWRTRRRSVAVPLILGGIIALGAMVAADRFFLGGALILQRFHSLNRIINPRHFPIHGAAGLFGIFADQEFGLLFWSPIWLLLPLGLWRVFRSGEDRRPLWLLLPVAAYLIVMIGHFGALWYGGFSQPARYLVAVIPMLVPFLARADREDRGPAFNMLATGACLWSALMTIPFLLGPTFRYNSADGINNLFQYLRNHAEIDLSRGWPSLVNPLSWHWGEYLILGIALLIPALLVGLLGHRSCRPSSARRIFLVGTALVALMLAGMFWLPRLLPTRLLEAEAMPHGEGRLYLGFGKRKVRTFDAAGWVEDWVVTRSQRMVVRIGTGIERDGAAPVLEAMVDGRTVGHAVIPMPPPGRSRFLHQVVDIPIDVSPGRHLLRIEVQPPPGVERMATIYLDTVGIVPALGR